MRFALVVFFFLGLFFALRTMPPPDIESRTAENVSNQPEERPPLLPPSPLAQGPAPTPFAAPKPPEPGGEDAVEEAEAADAMIQSGETERPGEERTSTRKAPQLPATPEEIETGIQKELTRLACFTGRPERGWGRKTRSALRRFLSRARPKEGNAPTEALLRSLRNYPANYCKTCRPGQAACKIDAPAPKRSDLGIPRENTSASVSYLPPWMTSEQIARAAAEEASWPFPNGGSGSEPEGLDPAPPKSKPKARRRGVTRSRIVGERGRGRGREKQARRRSSWPAITGWPGGR
jgi:hypothetical protein